MFDGVLVWYSVIHTPPEDLTLVGKELRRVLRPGGLVLTGFQAGTGERTIPQAYGGAADLHAVLHRTEDVASALRDAGLSIIAKLERAPREKIERHGQGFVLARRDDAGVS